MRSNPARRLSAARSNYWASSPRVPAMHRAIAGRLAGARLWSPRSKIGPVALRLRDMDPRTFLARGTIGGPGRDAAVDCQHPIDLDFPIELAFDPLAPGAAECGAQPGIVRQARHRLDEPRDECLARIGRDEDAARSVEVVHGTTPGGGDDGDGTGHRLEDDGAAAFVEAGHDQDIGLAEPARA